MLAQRRRRWANINPTLVQRLVFAGLLILKIETEKETKVTVPYLRYVKPNKSNYLYDQLYHAYNFVNTQFRFYIFFFVDVIQ